MPPDYGYGEDDEPLVFPKPKVTGRGIMETIGADGLTRSQRRIIELESALFPLVKAAREYECVGNMSLALRFLKPDDLRAAALASQGDPANSTTQER